MNKESIINKEFQGHLIRVVEGQNLSLTDMWKASGNLTNKNPYEWLRLPQTDEFITTVSKKLNTGKSRIIETQRGRTGGTWAHWQIGLAYAKYLSPELHMFINETFRERLQEDADPDLALDRGIDRAISGYKRKGKSDAWIELRLRSKTSNVSLRETFKRHAVFSFGVPICIDSLQKPIFKMKTAEKKQSLGLAPNNPYLRDNLSEIELASIIWAETSANTKIKGVDAQGLGDCQKICANAGQAMAQAIEMMA